MFSPQNYFVFVTFLKNTTTFSQMTVSVWDTSFFTAIQRSCRKVMFSEVSACPQWGSRHPSLEVNTPTHGGRPISLKDHGTTQKVTSYPGVPPKRAVPVIFSCYNLFRIAYFVVRDVSKKLLHDNLCEKNRNVLNNVKHKTLCFLDTN